MIAISTRHCTRPSINHPWHTDADLGQVLDGFAEFAAYDKTYKDKKMRTLTQSDDKLTLTVEAVFYDKNSFDEYISAPEVVRFLSAVSDYYTNIGGSYSVRDVTLL